MRSINYRRHRRGHGSIIVLLPLLILSSVANADGFLLARRYWANACSRRISSSLQSLLVLSATMPAPNGGDGRRWINADDFQKSCDASRTTPTGMMADAVAYNQHDLSPTYLLLNVPDDDNSNPMQSSSFDFIAPDDPFLQNADYAVEATLRWCSDFVAKLNLCPWAKLSLAEQNAIRVKVVDQFLGIEAFENIVRDSAKELLKLTGHEDYSSDQEQRQLPNFTFVPFHDFVFDLEDRLLAEADEDKETCKDKLAHPPIGDWITVAPFHPAWTFAGDADSPVAWEKRTPFPTVSIVRSDAVEAAGEEATARIAQHNEEVLNDMGSHALRELFRRDILQRDVK